MTHREIVLPQRQEGLLRAVLKFENFLHTSAKHGFNRFRAAIPKCNPHDLRRVPEQEASLPKVRILRHDRLAILSGILPYHAVSRLSQAGVAHMNRARKQVRQRPAQERGKVLVVEKFHARMLASRRSRSAANLRQAWMSS